MTRKLLSSFFVLTIIMTGVIYVQDLLSEEPLSGEEPLDIGTSVVQVRVTSRIFSLTNPWAITGTSSSSGSGIMFEPGLILTNAHVIANATFIQVDLTGVNDPIEATVEAVNHQVDLALLKIPLPENFRLTPTVFGSLPKQRDSIIIVGYPIGGTEISYTAGVVSRIDVDVYSHSNIKNLIVQTDAAINPGNSGGPVYLASNGSFIGIATQYSSEGQDIGYLIPIPVIEQFLRDYRDDGKIQGIPNLGIHYQHLENPTIREFFGMGKASGIRVTQVAKGSSADGIIFPDDIILEIDNQPVLNRGEIRSKNGSKLNHRAYILTKNVGDTLEVKLLRNKKVLDINVKLKEYVDSVIPSCPSYDRTTPYLIYAGICFIEVDPAYFDLWEKNMPGVFDIYWNRPKGTDDLEALVVISSVLTSSVNKGYEDMTDIPLVRVNDTKIRKLKDVAEALKQPREYDIFTFMDQSIIVISRKKALEEEASIRKLYNLPENTISGVD